MRFVPGYLNPRPVKFKHEIQYFGGIRRSCMLIRAWEIKIGVLEVLNQTLGFSFSLPSFHSLSCRLLSFVSAHAPVATAARRNLHVTSSHLPRSPIKHCFRYSAAVRETMRVVTQQHRAVTSAWTARREIVCPCRRWADACLGSSVRKRMRSARVATLERSPFPSL